VTDDPGFANPATFGGLIRTPTLDRLAASGISYNAFHTTAALVHNYTQFIEFIAFIDFRQKNVTC
jgi:hypothetical protein